MSDFTLPTTVGSIVAFDYEGPDGETMEDYRLAVTLTPGHYNDETGEFSELFWRDSFDLEGFSLEVTDPLLLKSNPEVIFEAPESVFTDVADLDVPAERKAGAVFFLDLPGAEAVVTLVPGAVVGGTAIEVAWVNSRGEYFTQEQVNDFAVARLVEGSPTL